MGRDLLSSTREHQWTWRPELGSLKDSMYQVSSILVLPSCRMRLQGTRQKLKKKKKPKNWFIPGSHPPLREVDSFTTLLPFSSRSWIQYLSLRKYGKLNWIFLKEMLWNYTESKALETWEKETFSSQYSYKAGVWTAGSLHNLLQTLLLAYKRCLALLPPQCKSGKHSPGDQNHFLFGPT